MNVNSRAGFTPIHHHDVVSQEPVNSVWIKIQPRETWRAGVFISASQSCLQREGNGLTNVGREHASRSEMKVGALSELTEIQTSVVGSIQLSCLKKNSRHRVEISDGHSDHLLSASRTRADMARARNGMSIVHNKAILTQGPGCVNGVLHYVALIEKIMKAAFDDSDYDVSSRPKKGYSLIFRPWFIHPRTKKVVYPKKSKVFPLWIKHRKQLDLPLDLDGNGLN